MDLGIINDPNWVDNYLRPEFKRVLIYILKATQHTFFKIPQIYELLGIDFMLDEEMNVWFLEANTSPTLAGEGEREKFLAKMIRDQFEVAISLLRSRMKRVFKFIDDLTANLDSKTFGAEQLGGDVEGKRAEWEKISSNKFDSEFMPSPENGFQVIVDENYQGVERYNHLLTPDCI